MPLIFEKVAFAPQSSLIARWNKYQNLSYPLHYHHEYELVYIHQGFGQRYAGDSIEPFQAGDLVLIGHQLPHCWQSDKLIFGNLPEMPTRAVIVQFGSDFFSQVFQYPEFAPIQTLLKNSRRGVAFSASIAAQHEQAIISLTQLTGLEKLLAFIRLLNDLATSNDSRLLASPAFDSVSKNDAFSRITDTLEYIAKHYDQKLSLSEIASQYHMSPSAFCNYFRRKTGKTLVSYINEFRVAQACKLLLNSDKNVSEIAFECGFNNLSNFNRIFKTIIRKSPSDYRSLWTDPLKPDAS